MSHGQHPAPETAGDGSAPARSRWSESIANDEGTNDEPLPGKSQSRKIIGVVAVVVLFIACGYSSLYDFGLGNDNDDERFDADNASFYMLDHGVPTSEEQLNNGRFYPGGGSNNDPHVRVKSPTKYIDMDGDQLMDAVATLEWTGEDGDDGWEALFIWIQDSEGEFTPVRWPGAWQWNCVAKGEIEDLEAWSDASPFGANVFRHSNNLCGADADQFGPGEINSFVVAVKDGEPVVDSRGEHAFATESCLGEDPLDPAEDVDFVELPVDPLPLLRPDPDSPPVSGPDEGNGTEKDGEITVKIAADTVPSRAELEAPKGYVPAVVIWWDDTRGCGWVEWDAIETKLPR